MDGAEPSRDTVTPSAPRAGPAEARLGWSR
jgi:hypothetical protein